jgi:hypothetical protein
MEVKAVFLDNLNSENGGLKHKDLSDALVVFWPFETEAFVSNGSVPLENLYAGRTHCAGQVSTVDRKDFLKLCSSLRKQLKYSRQAVGVYFVTPQPILLARPCCSDLTHCVGMEAPQTAYEFCSDVKSFQTILQRWLAEQNLSGVVAVCPHLELLKYTAAPLADN